MIRYLCICSAVLKQPVASNYEIIVCICYYTHIYILCRFSFAVIMNIFGVVELFSCHDIWLMCAAHTQAMAARK